MSTLADAPAPTDVASETPALRRMLGVTDLTLHRDGHRDRLRHLSRPGRRASRRPAVRRGPRMLVWLAAGILSLLGALTYAEMGAMKPDAGGLYVYVRDTFGPLPAFLYGWTSFFVIASGSTATLAVAFSGYLSAFLPMGRVTSRLVSMRDDRA